MATGSAPVDIWLPALIAGLLVAAALSGGLVWLLLRLTRGLSEAGDGFFAALARHDDAAAHALLSDAFLAATDAATLREWLARNGMADIDGATWFGRRRMPGRGLLHGQVHATDGRHVAMHVALVERDGAWKIFSLHVPRGPLGAYLRPGWQRRPGASP